MTITLRRGLLLLAIISVAGALVLSVGVTPKEAGASFCGQPGNPPCCDPQPFSICIQDATSAGASPANPYPSEISVQGLSEPITDVNVKLNGFSHGFPDDVAVQVVSPGANGKSVLLMSDVGGPLPDCNGCNIVNNINLTLDDEAANSLSDSSPLTTGTYKPTKGTTPTELPSGYVDNPVPNIWPAPAPDLTVSGSQLSSFDGQAPNGTWKLYVIDDTNLAQGVFAGGWSLELNNTTTINNTTTTPPVTSITSGPADGSSTTSNSAMFGFSSNEQGSTFQCQLTKDGAVVRVLAACTSPKSYSNLGPGNFRFEVKATDSDGMVDLTPASRNWTITSADTTAPKVSAATPTGPGIGRGTNIAATFSEKMNPTSISKSTLKLYRVTSSGTTQVTNVTVTLSSDGLKATLNPFGTSTTRLAANTQFRVVVTTGAKDLAGNALDQSSTTAGNQQKTWTFTTQG
jgi:hypothetical protein